MFEGVIHMSWGEQAHRGAIGITFDNFGEAAELEYDLWPTDKPVGNHYTAKEVLPEILQALANANFKASFFVEGWNGTIYPRELQAIRDAGHDLGFHGWRHEVWQEQSPEQRANIIQRSLNALSVDNARPVGFRPPGGGVSEDTPKQLSQAGLSYYSPVGEGVQVTDNIVSLPFRWSEVDALYFEPFMGAAREKTFGSPVPRPVAQWRSALNRVKELALENGGCYTVIFHAYLLGQDPERFDVFKDFLAQLQQEKDLWVAPCADIAKWLLAPARKNEGECLTLDDVHL